MSAAPSGAGEGFGLRGERVVLRPVAAADLDRIHQWHNDPELRDQVLGHPFPVSRPAVERWFAELDAGPGCAKVAFAVEDIARRSPVGLAQLHRIDWIGRTSFFGLQLGDREARGRGLGKEAMQLLVAFAFERLDLRKLLCEVVEDNEAALALYRGLGFVEEGRLRRQAFRGGSYRDVLLLALEKSE